MEVINNMKICNDNSNSNSNFITVIVIIIKKNKTLFIDLKKK